MFTSLIVQPLFNVLVFIYALIPGHDFGLAVILFTIVIRLLMWPLVKKQLHQTKVMRKLQPELKQIRKKSKGNKQKEHLMTLELYKERGVKPLGSIGVLIIQAIILFGLFLGLRRVVDDPGAIISLTYEPLRNLPWMQQLAGNISLFDETLFGIVDLTRAATSREGIYIPALIIVFLTAVVQYYQSKQLLPNDKDARGLRQILKDVSEGGQPDQQEMQAAVSRAMVIFLPAIIFFATLGFPAALGLYWLVGGIVAIIQQSIILREDEIEMEAIANEPTKKVRKIADIPEAEVVAKQASAPTSAETSTTKISSSTPKKSKKGGKKKAHKKRRK